MLMLFMITEAPIWPRVLVAVLVTVALLAAASGVLVCFSCKRMTSREGVCVCVVSPGLGDQTLISGNDNNPRVSPPAQHTVAF